MKEFLGVRVYFQTTSQNFPQNLPTLSLNRLTLCLSCDIISIRMKDWNTISPSRPSENYLIYTQAEGGSFQVIGGWTLNMFKDLKEKKWFWLRKGAVMEKDSPAFATFVEGVDNWDFVLENLKEKNTKKTLLDYLRGKK